MACAKQFFCFFLFFIGNWVPLLAGEKVVSAHIMGGLGNQLFQIANCLAVSWDLDYIPVLPRISESESRVSPRPVYWNTVFHKVQTYPPDQNLGLTPYFEDNALRYRKIETGVNRIELRGYYQSAKYFDHHREKILDTFQ